MELLGISSLLRVLLAIDIDQTNDQLSEPLRNLSPRFVIIMTSSDKKRVYCLI